MKNKKRSSRLKVSLIIIFILVIVGGISYVYLNANKSDNIDFPTNITSTKENEKTTNDLTGLDIDSSKVNNRPTCVMINNIKQAQPLLGVSKADVIYECLVEGGITRLMACYKDPYEVEKIGSVRSARPYFIEIASGMNGIYVHEGGSTQALSMLEGKDCGDVTDINLGKNASMMWRDKWRQSNLGQEHSALTSGELLKKGIEEKGIETFYKKGYNSRTIFSNNSQVTSGEEANTCTVKFSPYKDTTFKYDNNNQTYLISQFNEAQKDETYGVQNSKQNVIMLYINTSTQSDGKLQQMELEGSNKGYYMSHGKIIPITWHRDSSLNSPFYYKTQDGKDLNIIPGQTYICCVPINGGSVDYS